MESSLAETQALRVAVVTPDWPSSADGRSSLADVLARGVRACGSSVEVWTPDPRSRKAAATTGPTARVRTLSGPRWRKWGRTHWKKGASEFLGQFKPDLVVATDWRPIHGVQDAIEALPVAERPKVAGFAGTELEEAVSAAVRAERKEALQSGVPWLAFADRSKRLLARGGVPPDRVFSVLPAVIGPATPPDRTLRQRPRRLLSVAPLVASAGQDVMIEALARLHPDHPHLKYEVVGEGPDGSRLRGLAESVGVGDRVVFRGRLDATTLEHTYARADLFVLPGRRPANAELEPDYTTLFLEAASRGVPVLGSGGSAGAAGLEDDVTGRVLERPSDVSSVADAVHELLRFPLGLVRLARAGRLRFESSGRPAHLGARLLELAADW